MRVTHLELDLDVFAGPFDLLLSLILREELDLLEVDLAEIVVSYLDHLESTEQLDLESATEFLVLIAALLELKSRLMLPGDEVEELDELAPAEAAEELIERMLQYARFRAAGAHLRQLHEHERGFLYRSAPAKLGPAEVTAGAYEPAVLGAALGLAAAHAQADRPLAHGDAARDGRRAALAPARAAQAGELVLVRRGRLRTPTASPSASRSSRCSSSTSAARRRGSRTSRSARSPCTPPAPQSGEIAAA